MKHANQTYSSPCAAFWLAEIEVTFDFHVSFQNITFLCGGAMHEGWWLEILSEELGNALI